MRTKHIFLLALALTAALPACSSRDEKAAQLLDETAFREGVNAYRPVRTVCDSVFDTPIDNFTIRALGAQGWDTFMKKSRLIDAAMADLHISRYWAEHGDEQKVESVIAEMKDNERKVAEVTERTEAIQRDIRSLAAATTGEHIGWRFTHEYTCVRNGNLVHERMVLITDRKVTTAVEHYMSGDDRPMQTEAFILMTLEDTGE